MTHVIIAIVVVVVVVVRMRGAIVRVVTVKKKTGQV